MPAALKLTGDLNTSALEKTFQTLVQRHQSLRLTFHEVEGEGRPREIPAYNPLQVTDLQQCSKVEQEEQIQSQLEQQAQITFDLEQGPLFHLHLLLLDKQTSLLLLNMHHIISDGWSISVFIREWVEVYRLRESPLN